MSWRDQAACHGMDPALFYPEEGHHADPRARRACAGCPVRIDCLLASMHGSPDGVEPGLWGGLSQHTRRQYRTDVDFLIHLATQSISTPTT